MVTSIKKKKITYYVLSFCVYLLHIQFALVQQTLTGFDFLLSGLKIPVTFTFLLKAHFISILLAYYVGMNNVRFGTVFFFCFFFGFFVLFLRTLPIGFYPFQNIHGKVEPLLKLAHL